MTIFAVTFRIADVTTTLGPYDRRWNSVVENTRKCSTRYWDETTSCILLNSPYETAKEVTAKILKASMFDENVDLLVCIGLSMKDHSTIGKYKDQDLDKILAER